MSAIHPTPINRAAWERGTARRLNIGAGHWPLIGFTNLDSDPATEPDICATVPPIPYDDASLTDIYMGHVLEHFDHDDGQALLAECYRVLVPGGTLGVVVPDTREIVTRWLRGDPDHASTMSSAQTPVYWPIADLHTICSLYLYSSVQPSRHQWSYDLGTLARACRMAGFEVTGEIHRYSDPRISVGAWYQVGVNCVKPEAE